MRVKTSQIYETFAQYFMSLAFYGMVISRIGIEHSLVADMFFLACISFIFIFGYESNKFRNTVYSILPKLTLTQLEIGFYSLVFFLMGFTTEKKIDGYFDWIFQMIVQKEYTYVKGYEVFLEFGIMIIIYIFTRIIIKNRYTFSAILLYTFFILSWDFNLPKAYFYSIIYTVGIIVFFVNTANFSPHAKVVEVKANFYGPVIAVILSTTALVIPLNLPVVYDEGLSQDMTSRFPILKSIRKTVDDFIGGSSFMFSDLPFQPNTKKLGGKVRTTDTIMFRVKATQPLYLRGSVKYEYTGHSWEATDPIYYIMKGNKLNIDPISLGLPSGKVEIYPEKLKTRTILNPYFTYQVHNVNDTELIHTLDLEIMRNNGQKNQTAPYEVSYFNVNYLGERKYTSEELETLKPYTALPGSVTDRTVTLAKEITKNQSGTYEKLKALEQYLKTHYPYTLDTSELPRDRDFVDYFLFEEKKGYCTYFASAMAVMGRSLGIATRYVEGFSMSEEMDENGLYVVRADKAHAWVEAYVPGSGWQTFEPTGSLTEEEVSQTAVFDEVESTDANDETPDYSKQEKQDVTGNNQGDIGIDNEVSDTVPTGKSSKVILKVIQVLIVAILAAGVIFRKRIFEEYRHINFNKESGMIGFRKKYSEIIRIAKLIDEQEVKGTPKEIMNTINDRFNISEHNIGELVNEVFYSKCIITQSQMDIMDEAYEKIFRVYTGQKDDY